MTSDTPKVGGTLPSPTLDLRKKKYAGEKLQKVTGFTWRKNQRNDASWQAFLESVEAFLDVSGKIFWRKGFWVSSSIELRQRAIVDAR